MSKKYGELAYQHYLNTGAIYGMDEGAVRPGNGKAPAQPLTLEQFLGVSRNIPQIDQAGSKEGDPWSDELVRKVMWSNPQIVERAIDEGWIVGLYEFVRDKHKLPRAADFTDLRRNADFVRDAAAGRTNLGQFHEGLKKLAQIMMDKRAQLAEEFSR